MSGYQFASHFVLRFPYYPISTFFSASEDHDYFEKLILDDEFKRAVYYASPILSDELGKLESGRLKEKDNKRVECSLFKYLARMSTRCTPFALFSAVSCGKITNDTDLNVNSDKIRTHIRLDMYPMIMLCNMLKKNNRDKLRYRVNPTLIEYKRIVRYIFRTYGINDSFFQIKELRKSSLLVFVMRQSTDYISWSELINRITDDFEITLDDAKAYLDSLVQQQILVSELEPYICGSDMLDYYTNISDKLDLNGKNILSDLRGIVRLLNTTKSPVLIKEQYTLAKNILDNEDISIDEKYLFQVDSSYNGCDITLSKSVEQSIVECFNFLNHHTVRYEDSKLSNFRQRFWGRYETQSIPLLEALDPNIGVGYVVERDQVQYSILKEIRFPGRRMGFGQLSITPLTRLLLDKLAFYDFNSHNPLQLYDGKSYKSDISNLPESMGAMYKYYKDSNDKYIIDGLHFTGSSAVNLLARFGYCESAIADLIKNIADKEQESVPKDTIIAEVDYIPGLRTANILFRQQLRDYEIMVNANSLLDSEHAIPASDLYVKIENGQIILFSKKLNKRIIPKLSTAHNYANNPSPIYRFLCDLQHQSLKSFVAFSWGGIEGIYFHLPRVVYKDIVLSHEQWMVETQIFKNKNVLDINLFKNWANKNGLPQYIQLVMGDNVLPVDLNSILGIETLLSEMKNRDKLLIQEFLPDIDTRDRVYEIIVPLIKDVLK